MEELLDVSNYQAFKAELDGELQKAAEGFVKVGWLLKQARDTDILQDSGYANVNDFAMAEYGIDKSVVSRYIRINDRFSEGGNSPLLQKRYREFGYAKLAIMIQLPEEIAEEITPDFSKQDIQAIHEEVKEETKISDIEVLLEEKDEKVETEESLLGKVMIQVWHDEPELYLEMNNCQLEEEAVNILAPNGSAMYIVRIPGSGRLMMSIKEESNIITITNIRNGEKQEFVKADIIPFLLNGTKEEGIKAWEEKYEEPWPIKEPEPKAAEPKKEPKKESKKPKVTKAKAEKPKVAPVQQQEEATDTNNDVSVEEPEQTAKTECTSKAAEHEKENNAIMAPPEPEVDTESEEVQEVLHGEVEEPPVRENTQYESDMKELMNEYENEIALARTDIERGLYVSAKLHLARAESAVDEMNNIAIEEEKRNG